MNMGVAAGSRRPLGAVSRRRRLFAYLFLSAAMFSEVVATTALHRITEESEPAALLAVAPAYFIAYYLMSLALRSLALGIAYALWCGCGMVLSCLLGWTAYGQALDAPALVGIALIGAGVVCINLLSHASDAP